MRFEKIQCRWCNFFREMHSVQRCVCRVQFSESACSRGGGKKRNVSSSPWLCTAIKMADKDMLRQQVVESTKQLLQQTRVNMQGGW